MGISTVSSMLILLITFQLIILCESQNRPRYNRWRHRHGKAYSRYASTAERNATITYNFNDVSDSNKTVSVEIDGLFAINSRIGNATGRVIHVITENGGNDGCTQGVNLPEDEDWVALIQRGGCSCQTKIENHAVHHKAAAVLIYNNRDDGQLLSMVQSEDDVISVFLGKDDGEVLAALIDHGTDVLLELTPAPLPPNSTAESTSFQFSRWTRKLPNIWHMYGMLVFLCVLSVLILLISCAFCVWRKQAWKRPLNTLFVQEDIESSSYKRFEDNRDKT